MRSTSMLSGLVVVAMLATSFVGLASKLSADIPTPNGMQKVFIHDPVFNLDAFEVFIPVNWHFQGTLIQGTSSTPVPFPVFRASSPDGLVVLERLPRLDWKWGTNPMIAKDQSDCLPLQRSMSAQEFLKYISATLNVEYLSDEPVPADILAMANKGAQQSQATLAQQYLANHLQPPTETIDMARAVVRYKNGSFMMKGQLAITLDYTHSTMPGVLHGPAWETHSCTASIRYMHAPEAQYQAALTLLDPHSTGSVVLADWQKTWIENSQRLTQVRLGQIKQWGDNQIANIQANGEQFRHSQEVRQQAHNQFMSTLQRGTTMSMNRSAQIANSNHTIASDWVDYSLDRQTVRDPATGQVTKVSSANSYTWLDSSGKVSYQTSDVNVNPNGVLQGNWTRQTVVHGDGSY